MAQAIQGTSEATAALQDILVVDADPRTCEAFGRSMAGKAVTLRYAPTPEQARFELQRRPADLVLINVQIHDNAGLELLARIRRAYPKTDAIALTRQTSADVCLNAWRAGALDLLTMPMEPAAVSTCMRRVEAVRAQRDRLIARNKRLRHVCRQLNKARHEIGQQVNLLCHDLVKAYQDLAQQLNQTQVSGDYATALGGEVEIEVILRRTMEWMLKKLGPVNAAVFLPDSEGNYALGAYLNYDTAAESVLVETIGTTLVKHASSASGTQTIQDDAQLTELFGNESRLLLGRTWMTCPAYYKNECLGVLVLFQRQGDAIPESWEETLASVSTILADRIARAVRVYQRGLGGDDDDDDAAPDDAAGI